MNVNKSRKLVDLIEQGVKYTGTAIGPSIPVKIEDQKQKAPRLDVITKKKANGYLAEVSKKYYDKIPIDEIFKTLRTKFGIVVLQEDGTPWSGFIMGNEGNMSLDIGPREQFPEWPRERGRIGDVPSLTVYPVYVNSKLIFSWYRMPETGNYEINAYLS